MTTKFYLTASTPPVTTTAKGGWENTTQNNPHALDRALANGGVNTAHAQAETSTSGTYDVALARFVSDPLTGGTLPAVTGAAAFTLCIAALESSALALDYLYLHIWVTVGDTDVVRGTWLANYADTGGTQFNSVATTAWNATPTATTTSTVVQAGDRLVVEVGYRATNTSATSYTGTIRCGGTAADLAAGTTGVTTNCPWILFGATCDAALGARVQQAKADTSGAADTPTLARTAAVAAPGPNTAGALDRGAGAARGAVSADTAGTSDNWLAKKGLLKYDTSGATDAAPAKIILATRAVPDTVHIWESVDVVSTRADIDNYQFELVGAPSVRLGFGETIAVENFDLGTTDIRSQDQAGVGDYRMFGRDYRTPATWSFDLWTDCPTAEEALLWIEKLAQAWDAPDVRSTPDSVMALRYKLANRLRRVYGRPRALDIPPMDIIYTGRVALVAEFVLADGVFYDEQEEAVQQPTAAVEDMGGGFTLPLILPFTSMPEPAPRSETVIIGGTRPTWLDLIFHGPSTNPWVILGGNNHFALRGSIGLNRSVVVSGKPWAMGVTRDDGTAVPEMLDPRARLTTLRLPPGQYGVQHGGFATSTGGGIEIRWRNAYHAP